MRRCEVCRGELPASATKRARFCGSTCRNRANRAKPPRKPAKKSASSTPPAPPPDDKPTPFEVATRAVLDDLGAFDEPGSAASMLGQQVLTVARRMGRGAETGAAIATLSKEHSRLMGEISARGGKPQDPVDDVRERREQKAREAAAAAAAG